MHVKNQNYNKVIMTMHINNYNQVCMFIFESLAYLLMKIFNTSTWSIEDLNASDSRWSLMTLYLDLTSVTHSIGKYFNNKFDWTEYNNIDLLTPQGSKMKNTLTHHNVLIHFHIKILHHLLFLLIQSLSTYNNH